MKKILLLPLFTFTFTFTASFAQNSFIRDSLDIYVNREMKKWNIPGVAVAIVKDGKTVVNKGYGVKDLGRNEKVDEHTLFQIASNSKAFTGTSIALLAYQKRMSLDDKITKFIPDFKLYDPLATAEVTVRDMLCHRIGFETFQSDMLNWGCDLSQKQLIMNMRNVKPQLGFRSKYGYTNMGFVTAGSLIPIVADTTWDDFIKYHFFIPLKMEHSSTQWAKINSDKNACQPYTMVNGKLVLMPFVNIDNIGPCASINSSVNDLSHWLLMQLDSGRYEGKRIFPFSVLQMTRQSNMIVSNPFNPMFPSKHFQTYGLGWFLEDYNGKKIIQHDGGANGFVTTVCFLPEENLGITVLTNTDANYFYGALRQQIIDAYMNLPYRNYSEIYYRNFAYGQKMEDDQVKSWWEVVAKKNKPELELKDYAGDYSNEVYGKMQILFENPAKDGTGGKLYLYLSHHPGLKGALMFMENNTFLCTYSDPEYGVKKIPFTITAGKVTSVGVSVNDFIDKDVYEFIKK